MELLPASNLARGRLYGLRASTRLRPQRQPTQGQTYRKKLAGETVKGGVAVVVAAGSQASEGVLDVLHKLFAQDEGVLLLLRPQHRPLVPVLRRALSPLLEKTLDGFGEAFRRLSWDQVGARSMLSRAVAGVARGRVLVLLPGSPKAVALAVDAVLAPVLGHMVALLRKAP